MADATPKARTATQTLARISPRPWVASYAAGAAAGRDPSSVVMARLRRGGRHGLPELGDRHDLQLRDHRVVADPAVLIAGDHVLARLELDRELAHVPGHHHRLAVGAD